MNRREYIRRFLVFALLAVCTVLVVAVLFYERLSPPTEVIEDVVMQADVSLRQFAYTETVDGVRQWTLTADSAAHDFTSEKTAIQNVNMRVYDQKQLGDVVLTAQSGFAYLPDQRVDVEGDVLIVSDNGYRLTTAAASYHGKKSTGGVVTAPNLVTIRSNQLELSGSSMTLDIAHRTMRLEHNVTAVFTPTPSKGDQ